MRRPHFAILAATLLLTNAARAEDAPVTRIAFGSCLQQGRAMPVFDAINTFAPDIWIWMGDNIYGDSTDMAVLAAKYRQVSTDPGYAALRDHATVIGTWDDHDYGRNDAGMEYPMRAESQQRFLDFLGVPPDHPRRRQAGVYGSHTFGPAGRQVKVLLLDTRYHRDRLGSDGHMLGDAQWRWLERELVDSAAQVHLLVSSIQLAPTEHPYEKWSNFPTEHARLYRLLSRVDVPPVTALSGDRHLAEISIERDALPYPLLEITSSSLNKPLGGRKDEPNRRRLGENFPGANFGTLQIDWSTTPPTLRFEIRDKAGTTVLSQRLQQKR